MEVTINEIKANLESLPESFYSEVNDFIDFLKDKHRRANSNEIPEWQKEEVRKRAEYARNNPLSFVSESEMNDYLKDLENEG
ncbi:MULTISPECIES: hypothetical protein [Chryseobacterium]|uniref:DUF2281 domain-containing protein n=1 Tax=Chryseobacterium endophyticum TaxID=1854762 RepID=A0AAU6WTZ5_9FLAO|nr:hypothetical protein [uncultured Chryseobacterium sp.]